MQTPTGMSAPQAVTSLPRAAASALSSDAAIPLMDWSTLALIAGRGEPILPHMAWVLRFPDAITREELEAEARRLASRPYGFGRRVASARLPGGRPRWVPAPEPPPVELASQPAVGRAGLAAWLDRHVSTPLDPEYDHGWRLFATPTDDGGTVVLVICHHLYGTGGGIIRALYADDEDPSRGTTETPFTDTSRYTLAEEARGVLERIRLGLRGAAKVPRELAAALRAKPGGQPAAEGPPSIKPPRGRDRSRRPTSNLRVAAFASMDAELWDGAAAQRGGTGNTLLAAALVNLLRRARIARGGRIDRPLRILMPVDLHGRDLTDVAALTSGPAPQMTTAAVLVPGGPPEHGDLRDLRQRMKAAFVADTASAPMIRGAGDVMRLLPEPITLRFAARAARVFDGCASNIGAVPDGMLDLGAHRATDMAMLGFPIGNEAIIALCRYDGRATVSLMTDPVRLGPAADLRDWLATELEAWGLGDDVVW